MASAFVDILERHHKDDDEFLNHIIRVTDDEIWILFMDVVESKEQSSSGRTHIHQTIRKSFNKFCLPARNLVETVFLDRKEVLMVKLMKHGSIITAEVYCETVKNCIWSRRTKGVQC
jgi:hypothetical protein